MITLTSTDDQLKITLDEGDDVILGRHNGCDLQMNDGSISSQHARLRVRDSQFLVVDLGSTNGTRLNYSLINEPRYVLDGDTLEFGNLTFVVDGPGLSMSEHPPPDQKVLTDLEPLESSRKIDDTMIDLEVSETDLAQDGPAWTTTSETEGEQLKLVPSRYANAVAFLLFLAAGALLLIRIWLHQSL